MKKYSQYDVDRITKKVTTVMNLKKNEPKVSSDLIVGASGIKTTIVGILLALGLSAGSASANTFDFSKELDKLDNSSKVFDGKSNEKIKIIKNQVDKKTGVGTIDIKVGEFHVKGEVFGYKVNNQNSAVKVDIGIYGDKSTTDENSPGYAEAQTLMEKIQNSQNLRK